MKYRIPSFLHLLLLFFILSASCAHAQVQNISYLRPSISLSNNNTSTNTVQTCTVNNGGIWSNSNDRVISYSAPLRMEDGVMYCDEFYIEHKYYISGVVNYFYTGPFSLQIIEDPSGDWKVNVDDGGSGFSGYLNPQLQPNGYYNGSYQPNYLSSIPRNPQDSTFWIDFIGKFDLTNVTAAHRIVVYMSGDPIYFLMDDLNFSTSGGGEGGVDGDDWEYWFNYAGPGEPGNGKFFDVYAGLTDWFGTEADPGGQMQDVLGTLTDIYDTLSTGDSSGVYDGDIDLSDTEFLYIDNDDDGLGIIEKRTEIMEIFEDLSIPEAMTDATEAPTIEFDLPIDEWFGGLVNNLGASGVDMEPLHVEIMTDPFDEVRDPLHIIVFMLLSVWACLFVFNELKRA